MSDLIRRDDVIYLITHQRNAILEAAEREAPHHADVLLGMAGWWKELAEAVKKLKGANARLIAAAPDEGLDL